MTNFALPANLTGAKWKKYERDLGTNACGHLRKLEDKHNQYFDKYTDSTFTEEEIEFIYSGKYDSCIDKEKRDLNQHLFEVSRAVLAAKQAKTRHPHAHEFKQFCDDINAATDTYKRTVNTHYEQFVKEKLKSYKAGYIPIIEKQIKAVIKFKTAISTFESNISFDNFMQALLNFEWAMRHAG